MPSALLPAGVLLAIFFKPLSSQSATDSGGYEGASQDELLGVGERLVPFEGSSAELPRGAGCVCVFGGGQNMSLWVTP